MYSKAYLPGLLEGQCRLSHGSLGGVTLALTDRFAALVGSEPSALELDRAMLLIAAHERPEISVDDQLQKIDDLAAGCSAPTLDGVRRQLFQFDGFAGDSADYYNPDNSLLDQVLLRRVGIPITLSVLAIEVGRRLGVPMDPVGMPGHFLIRDRVLSDVFVDPFHGGAQLSASQCRRFFHTMHGPNAPWDDSYLEPVGKVDVLYRSLNNLRAISVQTGEAEREIWVLRLMSRLPGAPVEPATTLVQLLVARGQYDEAADELDHLGEVAPEQREQARRRAVNLRSRLN